MFLLPLHNTGYIGERLLPLPDISPDARQHLTNGFDNNGAALGALLLGKRQDSPCRTKRTVLPDSLRHGNLDGDFAPHALDIEAAFHAAVHCVHNMTLSVRKGNP